MISSKNQVAMVLFYAQRALAEYLHENPEWSFTLEISDNLVGNGRYERP